MRGEVIKVEGQGAPAEDIAAELAHQLGRSKKMPLRPQDTVLLEGADCFHFGPDESRIAWSVGQGPLVLLVHGWGGRGTQMGGLAHALANIGFRCVFFDAGGHGDSRQELVGFDTFIADTDALSRHLGQPIFAWIGHSAGGLGMMAARALLGLAADRYVCISTPLYPYVPLETIRKNTGFGDDVLDHLKPLLAAQFKAPWDALESGLAYEVEGGGKLLLACDRDDERVRHQDADTIASAWPGARVMKTDGYGHNRILQAPEVWREVQLFLKEPG